MKKMITALAVVALTCVTAAVAVDDRAPPEVSNELLVTPNIVITENIATESAGELDIFVLRYRTTEGALEITTAIYVDQPQHASYYSDFYGICGTDADHTDNFWKGGRAETPPIVGTDTRQSFVDLINSVEPRASPFV